MKNKKIIDKSEGDINSSKNRKEWIENKVDENTLALLHEDAEYYLHQALSTPCLNVLKSCKGSVITDIEGREYLDFHGNNVHQVGYGNKKVINAIKEQIDTLSFCPRRYTNLPAIKLAEKLAEIAPGNLNKVLLAPGGASAIGIALKLARIITGRFKTISWWGSFHGASLDAISIGGEAHFRKGIGPLLPGAIHVPPPLGKDANAAKFNGLSSPEYINYVMENEGDVAAFIAEPVRYSVGIVPSKEYWKEVREICTKHGALLIFDEIPACLGRSGKMFVTSHFDVVPDILCIGKGLGGGIFPLAAVITKKEYDIAGHTSLGHFTHEKNPVACAAALAAINYIEEKKLIEQAVNKGEYFVKRINLLKQKYPFIGEVRTLGLMTAAEIFQKNNLTQKGIEEADKIMYKSLEFGLSFKVSMANILTLMPPLTVSKKELDMAVNILDEALAAV